jgi:hypothetical protein
MKNTSRHVKGNPNTVPDFIKLKPGFDAMYGAGGMIIVSRLPPRVLPVRMIVHTFEVYVLVSGRVHRGPT